MKNYSTRYKILSTFCLLFIVAISLMFTFLVGAKTKYYNGGTSYVMPVLPDSIRGNVFYWIVKVVAILWIVAVIALSWLKNASFHKYFPLTLAGVLFQAVPALCRIGFKAPTNIAADNGSPVSTWVYFLVIILLFVFLGCGLLYAISNDQFKDAERQAKHSSNYRK